MHGIGQLRLFASPYANTRRTGYASLLAKPPENARQIRDFFTLQTAIL